MHEVRLARLLRAALGAGGRAYRFVVVRGRWIVAALWAGAVVLVLTAAPIPITAGTGAGFSTLVPVDSPALKVEERSLAQFRVPVLSGTTVVLHAPDGLTAASRIAAARQAFDASKDALEGDPATTPGHILAAVPVPLLEPDTQATYLFFSPGTTIWTTTHLAHLYASSLHRATQADGEAVATGFVPAQVDQAEVLAGALHWFEIVSLIAIAVIVAFVFRSLLAPVAVLVVAGAGYLVYSRVLGLVVAGTGLTVPQQLEPVLAALFIGVVTDYCVLFFSSQRDALVAGEARLAAVDRAVRLDGPVIAVAGITVTGGLIALLASPFLFFRALGPAMAITVLAALLVSLTLTPALMAILGSRLFALRGAGVLVARHEARPGWFSRAGRAVGRGGLFVLTTRPGAFIAVLAGGALLLAAAAPLLHAGLSLSFTAGLPGSTQTARGAQLVGAAGIRGITAPTEVLVEGNGVTDRTAELARMQSLLAAQRGVARVLGPADVPLDGIPLGIVAAPSGNAARFVVILADDPLGGTAVRDVRALEVALPGLLEQAGLDGMSTAITGQSVIASEVSRLTIESLRNTLLAALAIELLILLLYLRSVLAPLVVLLAGLVSTAAALGLTVLLFQDGLGQPGLTFFAPFSTAVLLLALGSDYTVFTVGAIWREARTMSIREAIRTAMPSSARAVTAAGFILATTFASVAIIPLAAFRQIAFTMAIGLLIDTLVVRPVITPALLVLLGRAARWPGGRRDRSEEDAGVGLVPALRR